MIGVIDFCATVLIICSCLYNLKAVYYGALSVWKMTFSMPLLHFGVVYLSTITSVMYFKLIFEWWNAKGWHSDSMQVYNDYKISFSWMIYHLVVCCVVYLYHKKIYEELNAQS